MKKLFFLLSVIAFISCKNDSKSEENNTPSEKQDNTERTEKQSDG